MQLFIVVVNRPGQAPEDCRVDLLDAEAASEQLEDELTITSHMLVDAGEGPLDATVEEQHEITQKWNGQSELNVHLGPFVHSIIPITLP